MACTVAIRGKTDAKLPPSTVINRDPCGRAIVNTVNGVNVSAESLCLPHWAAKHGQADVRGIIT